MKNIILLADSYKYSHFKQYPENITYMHSYLEARGTNREEFHEIKFFGLQYYIKKYLMTKITKEMVEEAQEIVTMHGLPFNYSGWMRVVEEHDGYIPLKIRAVKEGTVVDINNVIMSIESTDSELYWLTSWVETLLMKIWYPTTVATLSYNIQSVIKHNMLETCDNLDKLPFMLHDFGYRGVSSVESSEIGGLAHLINFMGSDTISAVYCARKYYNDKMAGYSIPASEHSTITSWGKDHEKEAYLNMIKEFQKYDLYACVSDSYDFDKALDIWGELKEQIIKANNLLVIRPDSGDAKENILSALEKLEGLFGIEINSKGYKVLNRVRLIQGDGVDYDVIQEILEMMKDHQYSAENIAFGMGGALLQGSETSSINRDTFKFAIKCSAIVKDGKLKEVYKKPITDLSKSSKRGRLDLICENGKYKTVKLSSKDYNTDEYHKDSVMITYYQNGKLLVDDTLKEIRGRK